MTHLRASSHRARAARPLLALLLAPLALAACAKDTPDAYGTFEATEVMVAAEVPGRVLSVAVDEGSTVAAGALLAVVDTAVLALQRQELEARLAATAARDRELEAQVGVIDAQRTVAQREFDRTQRLVTQAAATAQQADRAQRDLRTLEAQARALEATRGTVSRERQAVQAQLGQLAERLTRARVTAPGAGTVLARFVEPGELVQPGSPVMKLAALDTLVFRAYVASNQLSRLVLGGAVQVRVDAPDGALTTLPGTVAWVSSTAEFTPTPIQTREERVTQVYAVKVRVANPAGALKIGMPGELVLPAAAK